MSQLIPFNPMPFAVINGEWMKALAPFVRVFVEVHEVFEDMRGRDNVRRMLKWQQRQWRLLEPAQEELREARMDLSVRLCSRDFLTAAGEIGVEPHALMGVFAIGADLASATLQRQGIDQDQLWARQSGLLHEEESARILRVIQDALFGAFAKLLRTGQLPLVGRRALTWLGEWVAGADDERLYGIFSDFRDRDVLDAIKVGDLQDGPLSTAGVAGLRGRLAGLLADRDRLRRDYDQVGSRIKRTAERVLAPVTTLFACEEGFGLAALLCWTYVMDVKCALSPRNDLPDSHRLVALPEYAPYLKIACTDPLFWYLGLSALLRQSGAILGYGLRSWAVDLLVQTLAHPTKVGRMNVPPDAMRTRSVLAKWIAPMLVGYHPGDGLAEQLVELGHKHAVDVLVAFSVYLAGLAVQPDGTAGYRNARHEQTVTELWMHAIGPHAREVLVWMARGIEGANQLQDFFDSQLAALRDATDDRQAWDADLPDEQVSEEVAEPETGAQTWYYVPNPAAAVPELIPVELPGGDGEGRDQAFTDFVRSHQVSAVVKPSSIAGALQYFRDMPELIRAQTPYDDLNGQRWHKLKRGAQRIYVRLLPDGRLLFHPYARRDWKPAWTDIAA